MSAATQTAGALVRQPVKITVLRKGQPIMEQIFQHTPIRIGRLSDNDVVLPFDFVSRYHCEIRFDGQQWVAIDLGSKNGLLLDATTKAQEVRLDDGSEFGIQEVNVKIENQELSEATGFGALRDAATVIGPDPVAPAAPVPRTAAPLGANPGTQAATVPYPTQARGRLSAENAPPAAAPTVAPAHRREQISRAEPVGSPSQNHNQNQSRSQSHGQSHGQTHVSNSGHGDERRPLLAVDQEQLLFTAHPMIHQARERAIQMVVLWHDVVIDAREHAVGRSISLDWAGETITLGSVRPERSEIRVPRGCSAVGAEIRNGMIQVSLSEPNAFRMSEVLRVSFRYVPKSRDLAPASIWPEQRMVDPLLLSSAVHGAAILTALFMPAQKKVAIRDEPERFAQIIVAPTPPQVAKAPTPTPTPPPTPTPEEKIAEEPPKPKEKPTPPKVKKVVTQKKLRKVAEKKREEPAPKRVEKPPEKVDAPKVTVKEKPVPVEAKPEKPVAAATPVFNAKKVGALKMLDMMKAGPAANVANIEKIHVSRAPASVAGSVMGAQAVEGTGDMISKLDQSAKGGGTGHGDGTVGVAIGGKGAAGSYGTAGLTGKAGSSKVRGTVLGGATYSELSKTEGLTREQVMKIVAKHQAQIQACYERSLMSNPDIVGRADFEWEISAKGSVSHVSVKETTIKNGEQLLECVKGVFTAMKFPEAKNGESTTPTIGLPFGRL